MAESERERRREALRGLAGAVRDLVDVTVTTGVAADELDEVTATVAGLVERLGAQLHPGPYSGLLGHDRESLDPVDFLPLSPTVGPFNPIAPPLRIELRDGRVFGTVTLGRQHIGPPAAAHGGMTANLCDQMLALATTTAGLRGLTRSMTVEFVKPTPLYVELDLEAWVETSEDRSATARMTISHGDLVVVRATALSREAARVLDRDTRGTGPG